MALKKAEIPQTEWTRAGMDISRTATPLYQNTLNQLGDYTANVQNRLDPYLENYVDLAQASQQSDFLRDYQRTMSKLTGQNYNATHGGYSSANQRNYDDQQRYYNGLGSRLYSQGIGLAAELANQEYNYLTGALGSFHNAYNLGQNYSKADQYNQMVDDYNKNAWTQVATQVGNLAMMSGDPIAAGIGAGLTAAGTLFAKDFSAMDSLLGQSARGGNAGTSGNQYSNPFTPFATSPGLRNLLGNLTGGSGGSSSSGSTMAAANSTGNALSSALNAELGGGLSNTLFSL